MKKISKAIVATLALSLLAGAGGAGADTELTVDEIVANGLRANYYQGQDGRARVSMTIVDRQGRERSRELIILRRDDVEGEDPDDQFLGNQKFYVFFQRPADVRNMVFLVWKNVDGDDDRWLYMPALDLVNRIASSEVRTSFAGSHYFYEDVSGRVQDQDKHELVETTEHFYVLRSTPRNPRNVEFAYYKMWIHRESFLVTNTKYFDSNDEMYRQYEVLEADTIQGYPTVVKARMSDERIGGHTILEYSDVQYDIGLPDDIFTERYLRRAPRQYLR